MDLLSDPTSLFFILTVFVFGPLSVIGIAYTYITNQHVQYVAVKEGQQVTSNKPIVDEKKKNSRVVSAGDEMLKSLMTEDYSSESPDLFKPAEDETVAHISQTVPKGVGEKTEKDTIEESQSVVEEEMPELVETNKIIDEIQSFIDKIEESKQTRGRGRPSLEETKHRREMAVQEDKLLSMLEKLQERKEQLIEAKKDLEKEKNELAEKKIKVSEEEEKKLNNRPVFNWIDNVPLKAEITQDFEAVTPEGIPIKISKQTVKVKKVDGKLVFEEQKTSEEALNQDEHLGSVVEEK